MFVRGLFWLTLAGFVGPDLVMVARAEPRSAVAAEAVETAPAGPATIAAVKPHAPPKPLVTLKASVDLAQQTLTVIERGKTLATWKISSGVEEHATPRGTFRPEWTAKMWFSRKYDDAPMPHAVFFKDGVAVHATQAIGRLGQPASHGCVRLAPANAETFYKLVQRHGLAQTRIAVFGTPHYQAKAVASAQTARRPQQARAFDTPMRRTYAAVSTGPFAPQTYYGRLPIASVRLR